MKMLSGIAAGLSAIAVVSATSAQDFTEPPSFGSVTLQAGFSPDPHSRTLTAGGSIRAETRFSSCRGSIAYAPDYSVYYTAGSLPLIFSVDSDRDTTLVINGPDTNWYCDDDGASTGLNPMVRFNNPRSGRYDVWVGTYSEGAGVPATLFVSELSDYTRESAGLGVYRPRGIDPNLPARYGDVSLQAGFLPDPHMRNVTAGGSISAQDSFSQCRGYIAAAPDHSVYYSAGSSPLIFTADSDRDTTLVIYGPDGRWYCDDDGAQSSFNPMVRFNNPMSGRYSVWVGTYSSGAGAPATLFVSEIGEFTRESAGASGFSGLDIGLPPRYGATTLNGGFLPDPYQMTVTAGGPVSVSNAISNAVGYCNGNTTRAATLELRYSGSSDLHIYTAGSGDTTLAINGPDGTWYCNDDADGLNAGISFPAGSSGVYDIYVGTFSQGTQQTTLRISEISLGYGSGGK